MLGAPQSHTSVYNGKRTRGPERERDRESRRIGRGKGKLRRGQAQGKGHRMDSVSSSPAAVTRVLREAGGVGRG